MPLILKMANKRRLSSFEFVKALKTCSLLLSTDKDFVNLVSFLWAGILFDCYDFNNNSINLFKQNRRYRHCIRYFVFKSIVGAIFNEYEIKMRRMVNGLGSLT